MINLVLLVFIRGRQRRQQRLQDADQAERDDGCCTHNEGVGVRT